MDDILESDLFEDLLDSDFPEDLKFDLSEELKYDLISKLIEYDSFGRNRLKKNNQIIIDINTPEIGTKKEYFEENKITNQESKKDYYNNEYKEVIFYPFFNMDKGNKKTKAKYHLEYNYENDIYNLYILKDSEEEKIKIQINNKSIVRIMHDLNQNNIELYIFLKEVPKVYKKDNNISKSTFFFERFKNNLKNYDYENLYRNIDKNNPGKYYKIKHSKQILFEKSNNSNEIKLKLKKENFQREVSYFSMDDEYQNLYLNDLIIKISFINNGKNYQCFKLLEKNLKYLKIKIKNNNNYYEVIKSLNKQKKKIVANTFIEKTKMFYHDFHKLIPNLQFSFMSLLTV
jgi:hypothetical protein